MLIFWYSACVLSEGARVLKNVMASHYHPGAFGKDVQGQWSCCKKKDKSAQGCRGTTKDLHERSQSAIFLPDKDADYDYDYDDDYDDEDGLTESLPVHIGGMDTRKPVKFSPQDNVSVRSGGS